MKLLLQKNVLKGFLGFIISLVFSFGLFAQYGNDLIQNGGLEEGIDVFWEFNTFGGGVGSAIETNDAAEGTKAVEITVVSMDKIGKVRFRSPEVAYGLSADTSYVFRIKAKSPEGLSMKISVKMIGSAGSKNKSSELFTLTDTYQEYTFIMYAGEGYNESYQIIVQTGDVDEAGKVYLDDISFKAYEGDNLINNDFEEGINFGWVLQVKTDEDAAGTFTEETADVPSGSIALKTDVSAISSAGGFGGVNALSARKLISEDKYLIGIYIKGGAEGDSVSFGPQTWDAAAGFLSNTFHSTVVTTDWQWYYTLYTKEETAKWLGMKALLAADIGTIYLDNLTISPITFGSITSTALTSAKVLEMYEYQVTSDISGKFEFSSDIGTRWLSIDPVTGLMSGTPEVAGDYVITVMVANETAEYAEQVFTLSVAPAEEMAITSSPVETATVGQLYEYQLTWTGSGTFSLETDVSADWLSISQEGLLSGTPDVMGTILVKISLTKDETVVMQEFNLLVSDNVGIKFENTSSIQMYPNPASKVLYLKNIPVNSHIEIFSVSGKLLYSKHNMSSDSQVLLDGFNKGLYLLKISGKQQFIRRLVVK